MPYALKVVEFLRPKASCDSVHDGDSIVVNIAVIDYGIGNLHSASNALNSLGADARLTNDPATIRAADGVVLPGVGNFGACMTALREAELEEETVAAALSDTPFLGICVGMQMLFDSSEESPGIAGLGVMNGAIKYLPTTVKRPQMQWNQLESLGSDLVLGAEPDDCWMYFVHSLSAHPVDSSVIAATVQYGGPVVAAVRATRLLAVQFHPEKSGVAGLALLRRWLNVEVGL